MERLVRSWGRAFDPAERARLAGFYGLIALIHVVGWGTLLTYGAGHPAFITLGGLAYAFGLRHAFDADHISAIDNTTRKLLQVGRKPVGVGFFFSLGHSTVVLAITLLLGLAMRTLVGSVVGGGELRTVGSLVGTLVSGIFLVVIGAVNLAIMLDVLGAFGRMRRGGDSREVLRHELVSGGLMSRLFGRAFAFVSSSWHMYPIGFLFGLGFDTASEVALLAMAGGAAAEGLPFQAVLSLPVIFAAGMSLMDTTDGAFMAKAYSWAFSNPVRKIFYNLTVTGLSVFAALFVGVVELSQLMIGVTKLHGQPWDAIAGLDFGLLGFIIVGAFVVTWAGAFAIFRLGRIDERWGDVVARPGE